MTNTEKRLELFDEKFVTNKREDGEDYIKHLRDGEIKKFLTESIRQAVEEERERVKGGIENMKSSLDSDEKYHTLIEVLNFIDSLKDTKSSEKTEETNNK